MKFVTAPNTRQVQLDRWVWHTLFLKYYCISSSYIRSSSFSLLNAIYIHFSQVSKPPHKLVSLVAGENCTVQMRVKPGYSMFWSDWSSPVTAMVPQTAGESWKEHVWRERLQNVFGALQNVRANFCFLCHFCIYFQRTRRKVTFLKKKLCY